jgi:hypothetical protein
MPKRAAPGPLTAEQLRFAHDYAATPGKHAQPRDDRSIFLYHEDEHCTERWLVNRHGHVLECVRFETS